MDKYLGTSTFKKSTKFSKTTSTSNKIFTKNDTSNSDEKVDNLSREFNIHYIACIGSLIYIIDIRVDLSFAVQNLEKFS